MGNEIIRHYKLRDTPIDSVIKYLGNLTTGKIFYYITSDCNEYNEISDSTKTVICLQLSFDIFNGLTDVQVEEIEYPILIYSPSFENL